MLLLSRGLALTMLAACTAGTSETESPEDTEEDRYVSEVEAPDPLWTAAEAGTALEEALADGIPTGKDYEEHFVPAVNDHRQEGPPQCPKEGAMGWEAWEELAGCETDEGWFFTGLAEYRSELRAEGDQVLQQYGVVSDFEIRSPEGESFHSGGGGGFKSIYDRTTGNVMIEDWLRGSFEVAWADDWFLGNVSGTLESTYMTAGGTLRLDGSISWGAVSLLFEDLQVAPEECTDGFALHGRVHLRGLENAWYVFDFPGECGRCAEVSFHVDTELGEVCLDLEDHLGAQMGRLVADVPTEVGDTSDTGEKR